ncbi:MAG: hypothetical protein AAF614_03730 [Chloroflexota bacterium]
MLLAELTKEIKPLSRFEKLRLIETISRMLLEEEDPATYFSEGATYPIFTPLGQEEAAGQLLKFLEQENS